MSSTYANIVPHPTRVRYLVIALATVMAINLYLDRFYLSFVAGYIGDDLGLSKPQADWLLSAFLWSYALGQVPAGWLSDRFGARLTLTTYILGWSLFTLVMGWANSLWLMLAFRLGCGLAQAGAYPTSANLISKWVPFPRRGLASALVSTGGRIGGVAAPVLTAFLLLAFVPVQTSSLLTAQDILDADALVQRLQQPGTKPADNLARRIGQQYTRNQAQRTTATEPDASLLQTLNEFVQEPGLYQMVGWQQFPLPPEARQLAEIPAEQLTVAQLTRRNRLLLEAAFPEYLAKLYGQGWRATLVVFGIMGLITAAAFWLLVGDRPENHPWCNPAETLLVEQSLPAGVQSSQQRASGLPYRAVLHNRSLWFCSLQQFTTNFGWSFLVLLLPRYLEEKHQVPMMERGWMVGLPVLVGMFGMLAGGWLTDRLTLALGRRWGRRLPMMLTRFLAMAAYLACLLLNAPWSVVLALCVVAVAVDLGTPSVWAFNQDVSGRHVGSILGWGNMWGNLGAALSPLLLGAIVAAWGWNGCFLACAASFFLSGLAAMGVDATSSILPPHRE